MYIIFDTNDESAYSRAEGYLEGNETKKIHTRCPQSMLGKHYVERLLTDTCLYRTPIFSFAYKSGSWFFQGPKKR